MSADALRALFKQVVAINLQGSGDGEVTGELVHLAQGSCRTIEEYRDRCGYIRGLNTAMKMIDDCYQQIFNPDPKTEETT